MEKECGRHSYLYCSHSVSYLTLTAGDKGSKCPSVSPKQYRKGPLGTPPFATMVILSAPACHRAPLAARPPATCAWEGPRATRWRVCWSGGTKWGFPAASSLPRSSSCRVRKLVACRTLPERVVHRGKSLVVPWLAFPASSCCPGLVSSRQDPLAGALSLHLEYFVL